MAKKTFCDNCETEMGGPDYHYSGNIVLQPGNIKVQLAVSAKPSDTAKDLFGLFIPVFPQSWHQKLWRKSAWSKEIEARCRAERQSARKDLK